MRRSQAGFSLAECLMGMAVSLLILQALLPLASSCFSAWRDGVARVAVHQTARMAMNLMVRELRYANGISVPAPGALSNNIVFTRLSATGTTETLTFRLGSPGGLHRDSLYRVTGSGAATPVTEDTVTDLRFEFQAPRTVLIFLTLTDPATQIADSLQTVVVCRNIFD